MSTHAPEPDDSQSQQRAWDAIVADLSNDPDFVATIDARRGIPTGEAELGPQRADASDGDGPDSDEPGDEYVPSPWEAYLDEGYEPPEPPRIELPSHPVARFGWAGVIGGPLLVIGTNVVGSGSATLSGIGVLAFVAGFVALVSRRSTSRDDEDGGAVV